MTARAGRHTIGGMAASPEALLAKLEPGVEIAAGKVRGLAAVAAALADAGWIATRKQGRVLLVTLTEAGAAHRAQLAAAAPAPPPSRKRLTATATPAARLAALEAALAGLAARVATLEAAAAEAAAPPIDPAALRAAIIASVGDLDAGQRLGGLVPIPDVRAELRRRGVTASDADVTHALEELERAWQIDLSVAQAPTAVRDRGAGIERAGRGLLYYVARRA